MAFNGDLIVLRIRRDAAAEFEALFADEELPVWRDFKARGLVRRAALVRIAYGSQESEAAMTAGEVEYGLYAEFDEMAQHQAHDADPRFKAFLKKARLLQPRDPSVWGGDVVYTDAD